MMFTRRPSKWPKWVDYPPAAKPPERVMGASLRLTYINHATVLIQTGGLNLVTDPHYSLRCSPVQWAGPARAHAPGLAFENLPPIDYVLLSHNHYDHMDMGTLTRLLEAHPCKIVTGLKTGDYLPQALRSRVAELDWWQSLELGAGAKAHFVPVQHFSARGMHDRFRSLWGGFVLEGPWGKIYFPGDTAYGRHFSLVRERLGAMRMGLLPIGAYAPRWFMKEVHMIPEETVQAFQDLGCEFALGIHWGCFQLTEEPIFEPVERMNAARDAAGISADRFKAINPGQFWEL